MNKPKARPLADFPILANALADRLAEVDTRTTYRFRVGDHGLAEKRGHCTACSSLQIVLSVRAHSDKDAVQLANVKLGAFLADASAGGVELSFQGKITKRQMLKGGE